MRSSKIMLGAFLEPKYTEKYGPNFLKFNLESDIKWLL